MLPGLDTEIRLQALERAIREIRGEGIPPLVSPFLGLPVLRAFWPMTSTSESVVVDLSGQVRNLSALGAFGNAVYNNVTPYYSFDGATQYLSRADEAGLSITGALTIGGWFYTTTVAAGYGYLMDKGTGVNNTDTFQLFRNTAAFGGVVGSGAGNSQVNSTVTLAVNTWFFGALRYTASTELAIFYNATKTTNTTSIIASLNDNASALTIGATATPGNYLAGRAACVFVCAAAVSDTLLSSVFQQTRGWFGV